MVTAFAAPVSPVLAAADRADSGVVTRRGWAQAAVQRIVFALRCFVRCLELAVVFAPLLLLWLPYQSLQLLARATLRPGGALSAAVDAAGWKLTVATLQLAGPTFVKLGQWASTRPDLFEPAL